MNWRCRRRRLWSLLRYPHLWKFGGTTGHIYDGKTLCCITCGEPF